MNQVPNERRRTPRYPVFKGARLIGHGMSFYCIVRNLSHDGAGLEIDFNATMPGRLRLVLEQEQTVRRVRMRWRHAERMGVAFE